jgi:putative transposase
MTKYKLSHVVYECKYHIVLVPKYHYKIFNSEMGFAIRDEFKKLCQWMKIEIIEGNVSKDHVHLCLSIHPKNSVAEVIGTLKGKSAIRMFNKFPELRKRYWGNHFWSRGYYVNTVGINESLIKEYIKNQNKIEGVKQPELF